MDLFSLKDRVVVVTGGLGLLGQNFSSALVAAGAKVAIIDVTDTPRKLIPEFEAIWKNRDMVQIFKGDITQRQQMSEILGQIEKTWKTPWGLVNNAALDSPPDAPVSENGPFETYPSDSLRKVLDVNILGSTVTCQIFGGAMAKAGGGSIINISSIYGLVSPVQDIYEYKRKSGEDWYKPVGYSVTKSAILNLTRYLATYWGRKNVRVNTLTPSGIANHQDENFTQEYLKRMPMGRMAKPNEMNGAVIFLLSQASSYMTGSNLVVDGGWTAW